MKIIFDSDEQMYAFKNLVIHDLRTFYCPSSLHLNESRDCGSRRDCKTCWDACGLELEVKTDE